MRLTVGFSFSGALQGRVCSLSSVRTARRLQVEPAPHAGQMQAIVQSVRRPGGAKGSHKIHVQKDRLEKNASIFNNYSYYK